MKKLFHSRFIREFIPATVLVLFLASQIVLAQPAIPPNRPFLDFSGDKRTDFLMLRASGSALTWNILRNQDLPPEVTTSLTYGITTDQITPADYFGNNKTEISYYRGSQATFWETAFSDGMTSVQYPSLTGWGQVGDNAKFPGDYDGDGKDDHTVLRYQSSTGFFYWYIKGSTGVNRTMQYGQNNPETYEFAFRGADYNGDGRDEIVFCYVYIATGEAVWYFGDPVTMTTIGVHAFGNFNTDYLINPADYTGDRKAELAIWYYGKMFHGGAWRTYSPSTGTYLYQTLFGTANNETPPYDRPLSGDYDGDGVYDIAFYRPGTLIFFWTLSTSRSPSNPYPFGHFAGARSFGTAGDTPAAGLWAY